MSTVEDQIKKGLKLCSRPYTPREEPKMVTEEPEEESEEEETEEETEE